MPERRILMVLRRPLSAAAANEEGLRIAVGLTTANSEVAVLLLDGAASLATLPTSIADDQHGVSLHWETLAILGVRRLVERESLVEIGLGGDALAEGVEMVARAEVPAMLADHDHVLVY